MRRFDTGTWFVMILTFILFLGAVVTKGLTHELLLEAGVFLVSVKLIIMAYKNSVTAESIQNDLKEIKKVLMSEPEEPVRNDKGQESK